MKFIPLTAKQTQNKLDTLFQHSHNLYLKSDFFSIWYENYSHERSFQAYECSSGIIWGHALNNTFYYGYSKDEANLLCLEETPLFCLGGEEQKHYFELIDLVSNYLKLKLCIKYPMHSLTSTSLLEVTGCHSFRYLSPPEVILEKSYFIEFSKELVTSHLKSFNKLVNHLRFKEAISIEEKQLFFEEMVMINQSDPIKSNTYSHSSFLAFHKDLIKSQALSNFIHISQCQFENYTSYIYGMISDNEFLFYQSAIQKKGVEKNSIKIGIFHHIALIKHLKNNYNNVKSYHFLAGEERYKKEISGKDSFVNVAKSLHYYDNSFSSIPLKIRAMAKQSYFEMRKRQSAN